MNAKIFLCVMLLITIFLYSAPMAQVVTEGEIITLDDIQKAGQKLKDREKDLQQRESELTAKEEKLKALELDLVSREEALSAVRQEITNKLSKLDTASDEELAKLAKVYASTKPKSAASVIILMKVDKAADLMGKISPMTAGKIMGEIAKQNPEYASKLTTYMSGDKDIKSLNVDKTAQ